MLRSRLAAPQSPIHQSASQAFQCVPWWKHQPKRLQQWAKGGGAARERGGAPPKSPLGAAGCSGYEFYTHTADPLTLIVFISAALWSRRCKWEVHKSALRPKTKWAPAYFNASKCLWINFEKRSIICVLWQCPEAAQWVMMKSQISCQIFLSPVWFGQQVRKKKPSIANKVFSLFLQTGLTHFTWKIKSIFVLPG